MAEPAPLKIRDRVVEMKKMPARALMDNQGNWRTHPFAQSEALKGVLEEIGIAGSLLAYYSKRHEGALTAIDGHLRKGVDPDLEWPVLITDLNDTEADQLLAVFDPISAMAGAEANKLQALLDSIPPANTLALRDLYHDLSNTASRGMLESDLEEAANPERGGPPEMELQPFEHYDYIVLIFKEQYSFLRFCAKFGLEKRAYTLRNEKAKIGDCRAIPGQKFLEQLQQIEDGIEAEVERRLAERIKAEKKK